MRVLFWGTPDFGIPALHALVAAGHQIVAVVTNPDRPAGRGRTLTPSPVKRVGLELGVPILQPEKPRGDAFLERLRELGPDLSVVAAYGQILTDEVLASPHLGSLNIHASLLPELRGAAPVNWAIIRGHERSGVSVMRMVRELDAGPILHQVAAGIGPEETAGELYRRLSELGGRAIVEVLGRLEGGEVEEREQEHERATYAPKLDREAARIDWSLPARRVSDWIRGCDPWPAAWSELESSSTPVQLFRPAPLPEDGSRRGPAVERVTPGCVLEADPRGGLTVAAGAGAVRIDEVRPAGRSRMSAAAWVRGRGVAAGDHLR